MLKVIVILGYVEKFYIYQLSSAKNYFKVAKLNMLCVN
jgi:hypothetical protein